MKLKDKIALVTGGSSGIGRATAELFAEEGATVVVASGSSLDKATVVADAIARRGGQAQPVMMDVRSPGMIADVVGTVMGRFGRIDILVNSAGVYLPTPLGGTAEDDFDALVATNLKGTFFTVQAVAEGMKRRRSGRIVNVASAVAYRGSAEYSVYSAVKAGVVMLTRGFARDLAPHDVAVNAIAPGNTETPLNATDRASDDIMETKRRATPSTRVYSPAEEMARAILFLADGQVRAMHGTTVLLDEGIGS